MSAHILLARMVLRAVQIREESYDDARAAAASADTENAVYTDFGEFYTLTLEQAANKAGEELGTPELAHPTMLLLHYSWNDCQAWAENFEHSKQEPEA